MNTRKPVLCEERVRRVPRQFSWVDQRLIRDGVCRRCRTDELALYLLLIVVGDADGLSYYSDESVARLLNLTLSEVAAARDGLIAADLIAHRSPFYQVLSLPFVSHGDRPFGTAQDRPAVHS